MAFCFFTQPLPWGEQLAVLCFETLYILQIAFNNFDRKFRPLSVTIEIEAPYLQNILSCKILAIFDADCVFNGNALTQREKLLTQTKIYL